MTEASAQESSLRPPPAAATVAAVMRPPATTVEQHDHAAAAAYLMKHAGATALVVLDGARTNRPIGLITEADLVHAMADGKDMDDVRIHDLMTSSPTVINATTSIRDAAEAMMAGRFRHLPVVGNAGLIGMVDIVDVCRALLDAPAG
jgi:CBS domain-containing protein